MEAQHSNSISKESNQTVLEEIRNGNGSALLDIDQEIQANVKTTFSILSYNILAEAYSTYLSANIESKYLNFSYRAPIVIEELKKFSSDIICLQEVDNFEEFYKEAIAALGYEILTAASPNGDPDKLLLGVKKDLFEIESHEVLKFDEGHIFESRDDFKMGNVAIVAKLKHKSSGQVLNVINTHFHWDPRHEHIKYLQMHQIIQHVNAKLDEKDLIIWAGDLNSKINSDAIQYVLYGTAPTGENLDFPEPLLIETMKILYESLQKDEKKIKWGNAYESYGVAINDSARRYPKYTIYTLDFKETIDHILYSRNNLVPRKLLKLPAESEINSKALPNRRHPSDHLPLMTVFEVLGSGKDK